MQRVRDVDDEDDDGEQHQQGAGDERRQERDLEARHTRSATSRHESVSDTLAFSRPPRFRSPGVSVTPELINSVAGLFDLSKYTKPEDRTDKQNAEVGLCGMGEYHQYIVYDPSSGTYKIFNTATEQMEEDEALRDANDSVNAAFNDAAKRLAQAASGRPGYEDAEVTVILTDDGMHLGFADPMPGRRRVSVARPRITWLDAFVFVITLTAVRPKSMQ
jgi:hypothetical protein